MAVAREDRAVRVLVVVVEVEVDGAPMGQDENRGVEDEFVLVDPDRGVHATVGFLPGVPDVAAAQDATNRRPILLGQTRLVGNTSYLLGGSAHIALLRSTETNGCTGTLTFGGGSHNLVWVM